MNVNVSVSGWVDMCEMDGVIITECIIFCGTGFLPLQGMTPICVDLNFLIHSYVFTFSPCSLPNGTAERLVTALAPSCQLSFLSSCSTARRHQRMTTRSGSTACR